MLALGACSVMRFAYGHADNYFVGIVQDYFDPSPEQLRAVRANAEALIAWHRQSELPLYVAMFGEAAQKTRSGLTDADVRWGLGQVRMRYDALAQRILTIHAPMLAQLGDANFTALEKKFAEDNAEIEKKYLGTTPVRRDEHRVERVQRQLERWTGTLDAKQRDIVAVWVAAAPSASADWYRTRVERQQALLGALRSELDSATLAARIGSLWLRNAAPAEQRSREDARMSALIVAIDRSLSAAQRERVVARMQQYAQQFRGLME